MTVVFDFERNAKEGRRGRKRGRGEKDTKAKRRPQALAKERTEESRGSLMG